MPAAQPAELLEDGCDCRVAVARDLADALERLECDATMGVVLSDLHLPGGEGLDLLRRARECPREVAFVLVSAHLSPVVLADAARLGVHCRLVKPFDPEELLETVNNAVAGDCASQRRAQAVGATEES